jgi:phage baseplate assembly protein W
MSKRFLGNGWPFPIDVDLSDQHVHYVGEEEKIRQSALIILGTALGTRTMRPEFGSRLSELVFAPINASTRSLASRYATDALVAWEPRIDVLKVNVSEDSSALGTLLIDIEYRIRSTSSIFNLVYPFYLRGGKG